MAPFVIAASKPLQCAARRWSGMIISTLWPSASSAEWPNNAVEALVPANDRSRVVGTDDSVSDLIQNLLGQFGLLFQECTLLDWNSPVRFRFVRAPVASRPQGLGRGNGRAVRKDRSYPTAYQVGRKCWQAIVLILRPTMLNHNVAALYIAGGMVRCAWVGCGRYG